MPGKWKESLTEDSNENLKYYFETSRLKRVTKRGTIVVPFLCL
jgi:hypothetical protein